MARTARDVRALFEVVAGYDSQDPFSSPVPLREPATKSLRIGMIESFGAEPAICDAVEKAAGVLQTLGFAVEPFAPRGLERAFDLWWFFFGRVPAPFTRQLIEGREQDAHWTSTDFMHRALAEPPVTFPATSIIASRPVKAWTAIRAYF
jgi:Asp-tRNA(Asn)/Glu-tRNA(Gln) amidotransferase A subunit family amidase